MATQLPKGPHINTLPNPGWRDPATTKWDSGTTYEPAPAHLAYLNFLNAQMKGSPTGSLWQDPSQFFTDYGSANQAKGWAPGESNFPGGGSEVRYQLGGQNNYVDLQNAAQAQQFQNVLRIIQQLHANSGMQTPVPNYSGMGAGANPGIIRGAAPNPLMAAHPAVLPSQVNNPAFQAMQQRAAQQNSANLAMRGGPRNF